MKVCAVCNSEIEGEYYQCLSKPRTCVCLDFGCISEFAWDKVTVPELVQFLTGEEYGGNSIMLEWDKDDLSGIIQSHDLEQDFIKFFYSGDYMLTNTEWE